MAGLNLYESTAMVDLRISSLSRVFIASAFFLITLSAAQLARAQADSTTNTINFPPPPKDTVSSLDLENMTRVADVLDTIKNGLDVAGLGIDTKGFKRLDDVIGYTKDFADLSLALRTDLAEKQDPSASYSHTQQKLAQIRLELITDPDRLHDLALSGLISATAERRLGYFSFGAGDIAEGVATMAKHDAGYIGGVETTLDGIVKTAWGIYGYALTGNWEVAQGYAAAGALLAKSGRDLTLPIFEQITAKISGADDKIFALWVEANKVRIAHGLPPLTIAQFYHGDPTILDKVDPESLARADAGFGLTNQFARRTYESYRETCISGDCSRINLRPQENLTDEKPLGGVRLDQPLTGAALRGVKIDAANGNVVLIGERDFLARGLKLRDFAMALWLVYGPQAQDPAFSLDPDDIRNPRGPWLRARYVPDALQGRSFGADLFAADLLLKELSFQVKPNSVGRLEEWQSAVPGFRSYAQLALADAGNGSSQEQWARFWIVAEQVTSRQAGDTLLFEARMAVKARRQVPDPASPTGLRDIDTNPTSLEAHWAQIATEHYEALAAESPALARVRDLAIAIGIAKSLKAAGAQVDLARVANLLNDDHSETVSKISAFTISRQYRSETPFREGNRQGVQIETRTIHLFGGVDLSVNPRVIRDDSAARGMRGAVETAFGSADPEAHIVRFAYDGSQLVAVALPLLVKK